MNIDSNELNLRRENFGKQLTEARKNAGMSQTELGKAIGTTGANITRYEKGVTFPTVYVLMDIAKTLNVSIDSLLSNQVDDNRAIVEDVNKSLQPYKITFFSKGDQIWYFSAIDNPMNPNIKKNHFRLLGDLTAFVEWYTKGKMRSTANMLLEYIAMYPSNTEIQSTESIDDFIKNSPLDNPGGGTGDIHGSKQEP